MARSRILDLVFSTALCNFCFCNSIDSMTSIISEIFRPMCCCSFVDGIGTNTFSIFATDNPS